MHPLVANIHPSFRTAFFVWILSRTVAFAGVMKGLVDPWQIDTKGPPIWGSVAELVSQIPFGPSVFYLLGELLLLFAFVASYKFSRKELLPQGAEHATWILALSPMLFMVAPNSADLWGVSLALIAIGSVTVGSFTMASVAIFFAVCLMPATVFVIPGISAIAFTTKNESGQRGFAVPLVGLAAFSITILGSVFFSDPSFLSRGLALREVWILSMNDLLPIIGAVALAAITGVGIFRTKQWRWAFFMIPLFAPILFASPADAWKIAALSLPICATSLALITEDYAFQRTTVVAAALGSAWLVL